MTKVKGLFKETGLTHKNVKMNTNRKDKRALEHYQINVKHKLSALWASIMLCYIYGDYFSLYSPGVIKGMMAKSTPFGETTPMLILMFAVSMAIPASMISISILLKPRINRLLNIVVGGLYTMIVFLTLTNPEPWSTYYIFLGVIEVIFSILIVRYAVKWPRQKSL